MTADNGLPRPSGTGSHASHEAPSGLRPSGFDPAREEVAEPDEEVWLRDLDGTGSMHPCAPHDPGAIRYIREDLA